MIHLNHLTHQIDDTLSDEREIRTFSLFANLHGPNRGT